MYELITLGRVDLTSPDRGSVRTLLTQPRRVALLVYLLVEAPGGFVRRDKLLAMFWPEADETRSRASLRQALQFLRRSLGEHVLLTRGDEDVGIDAALVRCDALAFMRFRDEGKHQEALALYGGAFLDGFLIDDAPEFELWVSQKRRALQAGAAQCATLAANDVASNDHARAIELLRYAVTLAPLDERVVHGMVRLLDAGGDRAGALVELEQLRVRLERELGVVPSPETVALEVAVRGRTESHVEAHAARADVQSAQDVRDAHVVRDARDVHVAPVLPEPAERNRRNLAIPVLGLVLVAVVAIMLSVGDYFDRSDERLPTGTRVVVVPFANYTSDSSLASVGIMAADWITEGLSRVEGLSIVPLTATTATTRGLGITMDTGSDSDASLAKIADELHATMLVSGAVYRTGATLHLQAKITRVPSGAVLRAAETVSVPIDSVMQAIDQLRTKLVAGIAPLSDSVSHLRRAVAPPTYEAYRDYVDGLQLFVNRDMAGALALYERSAAADSNYPMPRIAAAITLANLEEADSAAAIVATLNKDRSRLGPLERATLDMIDGILSADLNKVDRAVREQARIAPGTIGEYMVGESARKLGQPRRAVAALRALGPERGELRGWRPYWRELAGALHMTRDFEGELSEAQNAIRIYDAEEPQFLAYAVRALAALGRENAVDSVIARRATMPGDASPDEGALLYLAANELDARLDTIAGKTYRQRERQWYEQRTGRARTSGIRLRHARALLLLDQADAATDSLRAIRAEGDSSVSAIGLSAVTAARMGRFPDSDRFLAQLHGIDSRRTTAQRALAEGDVAYWVAATAAQRRNHAMAVSTLRDAFSAGRPKDPGAASDPLFAPIRSNPEYGALLRYDG